MTKRTGAIARKVLLLAGALLLIAAPGAAQNRGELGRQIDKIVGQPLYRHASFGIEVYSLDDHKVVYARDAQKLFTPASTTKLLTEGTALELLGADYRFHTRVYRTGPIERDGTLKGDLVLVASGDPNLSARVRPDGTLAFENVDHAYDGSPDTKAVPGDPLLVIRDLARQVAAKGIKRIEGRVLVDVSLFPEGARELGTGVVISPVVVNDNLVDVTARAGAKAGDPVRLSISPETAYVRFVNQAKTGAVGTRPSIRWAKDEAQADGSHVVTVGGTLPAGGPSILYSYAVPQPSRYAEVALVEALREAGVRAAVAPYGKAVDFGALGASYTPGNVVAEHVSPPFSQEIKVTLKVSQNLHASTTPYLLGALVGHKKEKIEQAGFDLEHAFLSQAGLDLSGASQSDGAGGAIAAFFTPDFMCHYLAFMATEKNFALFHRALPVLGRDGTLWNIQVNSPAAGHVHAKTGTFIAPDRLNRNMMLTAKGLAGYMTAANGRRYTFALYANRVSLPMGSLEDAENKVGGTLGAIASAIYESGGGQAGKRGGRK